MPVLVVQVLLVIVGVHEAVQHAPSLVVVLVVLVVLAVLVKLWCHESAGSHARAALELTLRRKRLADHDWRRSLQRELVRGGEALIVVNTATVLHPDASQS